MKLEIENKAELNLFLSQHWGKDLIGIKGKPPVGATYDDGTIIENDVNVGWKCSETGESVQIIYKESE